MKHGSYRLMDEGGIVLEEGAYTDGERSGRWTLRWANGERAAKGGYSHGERHGRWTEYHRDGHKRGAGKYKKGARDGAWKFWTEEGASDPVHSGDYAPLAVRWPDGAAFGSGSTKDGERHGPWSFTWPDGATCFRGEYRSGLREGFWSFYLPEGSYDPELHSGMYAGGGRSSSGASPPEGHGPTGAAPRALAELPALPPWAGASKRLLNEVERALEFVVVADAPEAVQQWGVLHANPRVALPAMVNRLLAFDFGAPAERERLDSVFDRLFREATSGRTFVWAPGIDAEAQLVNRRTAARWYAFAFLTATLDDYWEIDLQLENDQAEPMSFPFPRGFGASAAIPPPLYAARFEDYGGGRDSVRGAADAALLWLADNQQEGGAWDCLAHGGLEPHGLGVTAVALSAFLAAGNTTSVGIYRKNVRRGVLRLLRSQERGRIGDPRTIAYPYHHAIATSVLCELIPFSDSPAMREGARQALDVLVAARNRYGAWRYGFVPNGENDTSVTAWIVMALRAGQLAGFEIPESAFGGALDWIDEMSDPATGRVGYLTLGGYSGRTVINEHFPREKGEAMTAAGLAVRYLCGSSSTEDAIARKHESLILKSLPRWDPGSGNDMYYWYWGSVAAQFAGGKFSKAWRKALSSSVLDTQHQGGELAGSWDPNGPWGYEGGRVYSTAVLALALLAPVRFVVPK